MTHPAATQNRWGAAARAAAAAAARLARRTRERHGQTPRKAADIADLILGSNLAEPKHGRGGREFKDFRPSSAPAL